ncbi:MAG TPA: GntR family transcriptional regulator [Steroidobacteraceae bacterium]|jgi:GntR family transcriptional regulator|nr:GntR family transcriptional regulator [Steroidobacteraceae bacterium]
MVPFKVRFTPGQSIFDQVCFAAIKSILGGELKAGEPFPSVRTLALDLKIHPNTAHKVVQHLVQERWLVVQPGLGTVVAQPPKARAGDRRRLLEDEVEKLVVEAMRVGAGLEEVQQAVGETWRDMRPVKSIANE